MTTSDDASDRSGDSARTGAPGFIPADVVREQFSRLRAEVTEARRESEKWRVIAEERERALERADVTIQAFATALGAGRPIEIGGMSAETAALSRDVTTASRELAAASRDLAEASRVGNATVTSGGGPSTDVPAVAPSGTTGTPPGFAVSATASPEPSTPTFVSAPDPADDDIVEIPRHVREEAERYAQTLQAISEFKVDLARPRRWWTFWR